MAFRYCMSQSNGINLFAEDDDIYDCSVKWLVVHYNTYSVTPFGTYTTSWVLDVRSCKCVKLEECVKIALGRLVEAMTVQ